MTTTILILTVAVYSFVFGKLHERMVSAEYGARCERDALGWWYRKPEFRELHPDQDLIEASDFRPLQGICLAAHFSVKTPRRDCRPLKLETYKRWENNHVSG